MLTKRSTVVLLISGAFLTTLLLVARGLGDFCTEGGYCRFRYNTPYGKSSKGTAGPESAAQSLHDLSCAGFPNTSNILAVMKTGASEAYARVPTQLMTNLRCVDDFLIFSDMEQDVAGYKIHDSLDTVLPEVKNSTTDFDLYFRQQECPIDQENCNKNNDVASAGWALDKYKNIHIAEKTYRMRPNYDWYIFIDADTYVVWPTLVDWVNRINGTQPRYLGSVAMLADEPFGHGGSGYLVSNGAMSDFLKGKSGVANEYDRDATQTCCGDALFAHALKEKTGVEVKNVWPTINGEKPNSLEYSSEQWCHPIVTMHHIGSEEVSQFDTFEQGRNFSSPLLIKDIFHRLVEPHLTDSREDWDNGSWDDLYLNATLSKHSEDDRGRAKQDDLSLLERRAHLSARDCRIGCRARDECMQWSYNDEKCMMHHKIKHGAPKKRSTGGKDKYASGWDLDRIHAWVRENSPCEKIWWPKL